MTEIQAGMRINSYVLDGKIGAGAFGQVWRARHHIWPDQIVAIKIPTDANYIRNLQGEGMVIHGLNYPGIVRALDLDPFADPAYLIMELVPGTNLRSWIQRRALSPDDAIAVLRHVLNALVVVHAAGIIHRDLKPENILIHDRAISSGFAAEGCVKIVDFGLGRAATDKMPGSIQLSQDVSRDGRVVGTLDYMAPEQRRGGEIDALADLYACGVLLYEMLTGELPEGHVVPSDSNPKLPKYLDGVFRKACAKLDSRYSSAAEFAAALAPPPQPSANQCVSSVAREFAEQFARANAAQGTNILCSCGAVGRVNFDSTKGKYVSLTDGWVYDGSEKSRLWNCGKAGHFQKQVKVVEAHDPLTPAPSGTGPNEWRPYRISLEDLKIR